VNFVNFGSGFGRSATARLRALAIVFFRFLDYIGLADVAGDGSAPS